MKWIKTISRILFLALFLFLVSKGNMMMWLLLFGVSLIVAIFFGRIYCGYMCPMNTVMIPVEWISKKLNLQTKSTPKWLEKGRLPWVFLGISAVAMIIAKKALHINLPLLIVWLVVSVIVTLRYRPHVFHNLICPFGVLQKTFGKFAIFSKKVDENMCIGCKKCEKVCPSDAIKVAPETGKAVISSNICHQCTNCTEVCPVFAISYTKNK